MEKEVKIDKNIGKMKTGAALLLLALCIGMCVILIKAYREGKFDSAETMQEYIAGFGIMAPVMLTAIQAAQVVLPVLPGFLGCAVGAVMFGCWGGFWCNYIGISAGSIMAFWLARQFGQELVSGLFRGKRYETWTACAARSGSYTAMLFAGMVLPLFPDDYFCYLTGLSDMTPKKFATIVVLGKPWCILAYSIIFSAAVS